MSRSVWLASYPKSGNTWFRLLLANLHRERPVDINHIPLRDSMASARARFDAMTLFPSGLLTHEECDALRPRVHKAAISRDDTEEVPLAGIAFIKTHDAWAYTSGGKPLLAGAEAAILIVRDPRAVAPSLASHTGTAIDDAITFLGEPHASFCGARDRQYPQLRQQLRSWSGFNASWLDACDLPLHRISYEELVADTPGTFARALAFLGIAASGSDIAQAVRFADFEELQRQERIHGFREAPRNHESSFFRSGPVPSGSAGLSSEQMWRIENDHATMMARLGYLPDAMVRLAG
jgi:hypothetical protein